MFGEHVQPAESKGDNRLPVIALHSKLSEERKRLVVYRVFDTTDQLSSLSC